MRKVYQKVTMFTVFVMLVMTILPNGKMTAVSAAEKTKQPVQLRIGRKKITKKTYRMKKGTKKKLKVVAGKKKSVRFSSNKKKVVSVSKKGLLRAKKKGTAKITVVVKKKKSRKKVWMKVKVVSSGKDKKIVGTEKPDKTAHPAPAVPAKTETPPQTAAPAESNKPVDGNDTPTVGSGKILIAYFTRSGNTEKLADMIQDRVGGTKIKIETVKDYPEDYNSILAEASKEKSENARPELKTKVNNMADYDTIFIGYPIWHGDTPMAIRSFLEGYNFSGKKVVPFCSSGSSSPETSYSSVRASASGAEIPEGFWTRGANVESAAEEINQWLDRIGVAPKKEESMANQIHIIAGNTVFTATLADNSSAEALKGLLRNGPLTINMSDYANMEKVGPIGTSLPRNDEQIVTEAGDIILYQGNSLVIYYDTNTWNFTKIGKIEGATKEQLLAALGNGDVTVTITLVQ